MDVIARTESELEKHFGKFPESLKDYMNLLNARVAELYQEGQRTSELMLSYTQ